jgi:alkylation response protein AidB-like acyl-CoA dehydrogenase
MAKLFCAETAKAVVDKALSVHGCYGYTKEFTVERLYREAKLGELYEGTPEMQKLLIASKVLWPSETGHGYQV